MSWTHEHSCTLSASPSDVFLALTDAPQLRCWFAEHVDVGRGVGAPFRFWGRHTMETSSAALATQRLTTWTPGRSIGFTWCIAGVDSVVEIALSADGDACHLHLRHSVSGTLPFKRERELIDDHWRYVLGNLAAHLGGGSGLSLPDFSDPAPAVFQTILIDAPRDVVFRTLTTPALINEWFDSKSSVVEAHVGGRYDIGWHYKIDGRDVHGGPTRIIEYVPNERLVLDWPDWRGDASVTGQTISFQLESVGEKTRVTFVHAGFTRTADIGDYPFGWTYFMDKLMLVARACSVTCARVSVS